MKRMLINARQQEELRVALVDGQRLYDLDIEHPGHEQKIANIYKGKITRIEPSLEAAFVDYGAKRHGFLPFKEIAPEYFSKPAPAGEEAKAGEETNNTHIKELISEGQEVVIQIDKEERGTKGAALTTYISLAGGYLVLMPNNPRAGGISRRIEGEERATLRDILSALQVPEGMGIIVRTAGVSRSQEELDWDLEMLIRRWQAIQHAAISRPAPFLIHQESDVITRAIRDYLRRDINEIIIDDFECYEKVRDHIKLIRPDFIDHIKSYEDNVPLFNRYQIENQIESAFQHKVQLPAGGSIVIDYTEALVSIDVNSARATKGEDIEETAFLANMEAAEEVARQCRLRDIGGLIVIDFIDMMSNRHQRQVEEHLREALQNDRARVRIGRLSRFGLLEMSRQRLRPSLGEASQIICPRCGGQGNIRSIGSQALSMLRLIEEEAIKEGTGEVQTQIPVEVATFILNEKRQALVDIEQRHRVNVLILPNPNMQTPQYEITRVRESNLSEPGSAPPSYTLVNEAEQPALATAENTAKEVPAVKSIPMDSVKPPARPAPKKPGLLRRLWGALSGGGTATPSAKKGKGKGKGSGGTKRGGRPAGGGGRSQGQGQNKSGQRRRRSGGSGQQKRRPSNTRRRNS